MKREIGPVTKATGGSAAAVAVLVWLLSLAGVEMPVEVQGALTTIIVFAAGWVTKPRQGGKYADE